MSATKLYHKEIHVLTENKNFKRHVITPVYNGKGDIFPVVTVNFVLRPESSISL